MSDKSSIPLAEWKPKGRYISVPLDYIIFLGAEAKPVPIVWADNRWVEAEGWGG